MITDRWFTLLDVLIEIFTGNEIMLSAYQTSAVLATEVMTISGHLSVESVSEKFKHTNQDFLPVIDGSGKVQGIVWRRDMMDLLADRFGRSLHGRKIASQIMDKKPIVVEAEMPLVSLSHLITEYHGEHRGDAFLIVREGHYIGAARFIDLLRQMTELQVESARYANPLSGLPGNIPIQHEISRRLHQHRDFSVIYVDVDHFKPYNDHYSFEQGDDVIRLIASLMDSLKDDAIDFIGHIGGDDFIAITHDADGYEGFCQRLLAAFQDRIAHFYTSADQAAGGIWGKDRQGRDHFFPIMSLSLGVLLVRPKWIDHPQHLASLATSAKKSAKHAGGNTFAVLDSCRAEALVV